MASAFACPACGYGQHASNAKCVKCGVQLNEAETPDAEVASTPSLSREAWRALGIGFVLALILMKLPFMGMLFNPLITIVHELGHTVAGWLFGFPSIPAFDFGEGGGFTQPLDSEQDWLGAAIMYVIFAVLLWRTRRRRPVTVFVLLLIPLYSYIFFTHWHQAVILAAGHAAEIIMASVFLERAMSGTTLLQADERPAYAMIGFLILFHDVSFFWQMGHDASFRDWYDVGKSYADNDLVVLLREHVRSSLPNLANYFLVGCGGAVLAAWIAFRNEDRLAAMARDFLPAKEED